MTSIPWEIQEAAVIDGCNDFQIFNKIIFPLSKAITVVMASVLWRGPLELLLHRNDLFKGQRKIPPQLFLRGNPDKEYLCQNSNGGWQELFRQNR